MIAILDVVRDLMLGGRHSRRTVAVMADVSLQTADRWLVSIRTTIPGVRVVRVGKTTWLEWSRK